jgi:NADH-quinone oxidoreductase subunit B
MSNGFVFSTLNKTMDWARSQSLWYISVGSGCCADEIISAAGCRYDLERFGCVVSVDPAQADLLIVSGVVSYKAVEHLRALYDSMMFPKYVMAIGSCANCGGAFSPEYSYCAAPGIDRFLPVDVYVPGCPPRPEAIMNGIITLQEKISGYRQNYHKA